MDLLRNYKYKLLDRRFSCLVFSIVLTLSFFFCGSFSNSGQKISSAYAQNSATVTIPKFATTQVHFEPQTLTVEKGTTVRWNNQDFLLHTVTSGTLNSGNSGVEFYSSYITPNNSFEHTFNKSGSFKYFCSLHPSMVGKVIVKNVQNRLGSPDQGPTLR